MNKLLAFLIIVFLALQIRIFSSEGGLAELYYMKDKVAEVESSLQQQKEINAELAAKIFELKNHPDAYESIARQTLGMTKENEHFYLIIDPAAK